MNAAANIRLLGRGALLYLALVFLFLPLLLAETFPLWPRTRAGWLFFLGLGPLIYAAFEVFFDWLWDRFAPEAGSRRREWFTMAGAALLALAIILTWVFIQNR